MWDKIRKYSPLFFPILVVYIFWRGYIGEPYRARLGYAKDIFRKMSTAFYVPETETILLPTDVEYWGPWTPELHTELESKARMFEIPSYENVIDPYNTDATEGGIRGGFTYGVDRGTAKIIGASPYFYTDGKTGWVWGIKRA